MDLVPHRRNRGQWLTPWERFFDEPFFEFPALFQHGRKGMFVPGIDVSETDNSIEVVADVPGYKKEDVTVSVEDGVLTIQGRMQEEKEDASAGSAQKRRKYYCKQCSSGSFYNQVALPDGVKEDGAKCSMKDGKLRVTIPKKKEEQIKEGKMLEIESD